MRETYRPGETLGTAFARLYARLFADWGVIVLDASDGELHRIAAPIYQAAIERSDELAAALLKRGEALEAAGYYQQVKVTPSSVLVFTLQNGARTAIHNRERSDEFVIGSGEGDAEKTSKAELLRRVACAPEQFSPNVLLRPIVQDYLLPTLAYTGGAAEAAYFAQAGAVYEALLGRVTPIVPRFSATIVEPKIQRLIERQESRSSMYSMALTLCVANLRPAICRRICRLLLMWSTGRWRQIWKRSGKSWRSLIALWWMQRKLPSRKFSISWKNFRRRRRVRKHKRTNS